MSEPGRCLHERFAARAATHGDRVAVVDRAGTLTYGELNRAANRLAHRIRRSGAGPETCVGVCADRGAELVIALIAVLKAGAAYVPLDPRYPATRRRYLLDDAGCSLVVGPERFRAEFTGVSYLAVAGGGQDDDDPVSGVTPAHAAYVIHTSGTTGRPKGVVVTHDNVTRLLAATSAEFGFGAADVWTLFHSFAFDFSVWELWGALLSGGRLVVVPYAVSREPEAFLRLLRAEGVTVLNQTPSAFRQLADATAAAGWPDTALRLVVFGGEALEPATLRHWVARYGDRAPRLVNMYGITETTVHVTWHEVAAQDTGSPIGSALPHLRVHVLDDHLDPAEHGEIYVAGAGVARGYLNRPALTAERFVPDPAAGRPGERMYRSGDLAVRGPDGALHYRGRGDDQVKLRGFRIEPGEIEAAVLEVSGVRAAVVRLTGPHLVCYVVADEDAALEARLRTALSERLPGHLVPARFVRLDALPLTANGKLDKENLPAARPAPHQVEEAGDATATLTRIFAALLDRADVGPHDDFFGFGGDSMTAVRAVSLAHTAGLSLSVQQLFRQPTAAGLATLCEPTGHPTRNGAAGLLRDRLPTGVSDAYPLSALQAGMIYHTELTDDATLYHDLVSVRLAGRLDLAALRHALAALVARHDVLRTSFDLGTYSEPLQLVHHAATVSLDVVESALPEWWRREWPARHFALDRAPLLRCHVLRHPDGTFDLALSAHHAILDGWSFATLAAELLTIYDRGLAGLPPVEGRYRDFVVLEREISASAAAREFWARRLAGSRPVSLPPPGATGPQPVDAQFRVPLPAPLVAAARRLAETLRVPVKSVWLAGHLAALAELTGADDVVSCVVANGRPETAGAESVLGLFLNCVPVRARVHDQELVRAVFAAERDHQPYRRFPLALIRQHAGGAEFPVLFNYASFHPLDGLAKLTSVRVRDWYFSDRSSFAVVLDVLREPMSDGWMLCVRADPTQTAAETAQRLGRACLGQLRRLVR